MSSHNAPTRKDFPADFRWGVSTSSFQIEGAGRDSDVDGDSLSVSAVNGQSSAVGQPIAGAWGTLTLNAELDRSPKQF